jgi:hypothetical protein
MPSRLAGGPPRRHHHGGSHSHKEREPERDFAAAFADTVRSQPKDDRSVAAMLQAAANEGRIAALTIGSPAQVTDLLDPVAALDGVAGIGDGNRRGSGGGSEHDDEPAAAELDAVAAPAEPEMEDAFVDEMLAALARNLELFSAYEISLRHQSPALTASIGGDAPTNEAAKSWFYRLIDKAALAGKL